MANIETGYQLLTRLNSRPSLENIYPDLFLSGPLKQHVIQISGDPSTGKTLLVTEIIAKCLLPEDVGGKNQGAILINTDHQFKMFTLYKIMEEIVKKYRKAQINQVIQESLKNLIILNCYDSEQLHMTFNNLKNILIKNQKITLVVLDSISAYYWSDRMSDGIRKISVYQNSLLRKMQTLTKEHNIVLLFTKPNNFISKGDENKIKYSYYNPTLEQINYHINLKKNDHIFLAQVTLPDNSTFDKMYKISNLIHWIN